MVGTIHISYYPLTNLGRKGNKPGLYKHHQDEGWVTQDAVIDELDIWE